MAAVKFLGHPEPGHKSSIFMVPAHKKRRTPRYREYPPDHSHPHAGTEESTLLDQHGRGVEKQRGTRRNGP